MNLRELAEQDLGTILEDEANGFGRFITLQDPEGSVETFTGFSGDISKVIDTDTGQAVSGRFAHVILRISSLIAKGFDIPVGIEDRNQKPWIVTFDDVNNVTHTFKVQDSHPDRTLGTVVCDLETYQR